MNVLDVQTIVNEVLGVTAADPWPGSRRHVADAQIVINVALGVTPCPMIGQAFKMSGRTPRRNGWRESAR